jgi:hypothetical protein
MLLGAITTKLPKLIPETGVVKPIYVRISDVIQEIKTETEIVDISFVSIWP